jgi:arabinofuranan 3-O-arabinosyltransferase
MISDLNERGVRLSELSVLEVGAGMGGYSRVLHPACREFIASDVNRREFFRTSSIPFELFNVLEEPVRKGKHDLVICASLIEHVAEPLAALRNIRETLKEGGMLFLTFPPFYSLSMLGGHRFKPFHFLGESAAIRMYKRNHPGTSVTNYRSCSGNYGLFPLTVSEVDRLLVESGFQTIDRYDRHLPVNTTLLPGLLKDLFSVHVCCLAVRQ